MDNLLLPRGYLSYTQLSCWMTNKERFRREYFENGPKLDTKYLRFGKGMALTIETGVYQELLPDLIVYEMREYEIRTTIAGVPILSFIDSYDPKMHVFREYKTGKAPWTQSKVQKHEQLLFYAVALKAITQVLPLSCTLDWIETKEKDGDDNDFWSLVDRQLEITGKIASFERIFDSREADRMEKQIATVANEISDAYKKFIEEIV